MRRIRSLVLLGLIACATFTMAQSDVCASALGITCGSTVSGNTSGFTADAAPVCVVGNNTAPGVWYRITGTGAAMTASLCGSAYDTQLRVFSGTCAALVCVTGNDDFCGLQSQVTWASTAGVIYYILVYGFGTSSGAYTLSLTCPPPPTPLCYAENLTPYLADPYAGTAVTLSDDVHSGVVPIGFPFCYNGNTYTQCVIASNNYITFDLTRAGTYSPWSTVAIPAALPVGPQNAILQPWQDIHPGVGGSIRYQTLGVAPYRRFVVSYQNVPMFSCTGQLYTSQIVLYESTNCIGCYILSKPLCTTWNQGRAVHGLQNTSGSSAMSVAGRNNTQWVTSSEGRFFTPTCAPCSTSVTGSCLSVVLPIELIHFRGRHDGGVNVLDWVTASESNSALFIVERSGDGLAFGTLGNMAAAGHSQENREYLFRDVHPLEGVSYYRLRMIDVDGSVETSPVITVAGERKEGLLVYPNPAGSVATVRLPMGIVPPAEVVLRDMTGRVVRSAMVRSPEDELPLEGLAEGVYSIELAGRGPTMTARFVIERSDH